MLLESVLDHTFACSHLLSVKPACVCDPIQRTSQGDPSLTIIITFHVASLKGNPTVHNVDGDYAYDRKSGVMEWTVGKVGEDNAEGNIEMSLQSGSADDFFPVSVNFSSSKTYAGIAIDSVERVGDGAAVEFTSVTCFGVESYDYV
jgi:hypothetical protein